MQDADGLIQEVMRQRGYPVDDFDTRAADLSVDHPDVVENYRAAHGIAVARERGKAGTDELRRAIQHYRALFDALVEQSEPVDGPSGLLRHRAAPPRAQSTRRPLPPPSA